MDESFTYHLKSSPKTSSTTLDYPASLNPQQLAAVTADLSPALVIAGAGSGKTRTLTYRVAYLLEQGIPPERILLLTFTNKAAREMMNRVTELLGHSSIPLWGGTFHSIGNRILRTHSKLLGFKSSFNILDRDDSKDLLNKCLKILPQSIGELPKDFPKADVLLAIFSLIANTQLSFHEVMDNHFSHLTAASNGIQAALKLYRQHKLDSSVIDFDDMLQLVLKLFKDHPQILESYQNRFQTILVDEYQDTNKVQCDLIDLLAARHHSLMVVGDDAQCIYSWRGANHENILKFPSRYPTAKTYRIETNYRSSPEILNLANASIRENLNQFPKNLAAHLPSGPKPILATCNDAWDQSRFVIQHLLDLHDGDSVPLDQIAILYRSHFHAMELQMTLKGANIPHAITSGIQFFAQAHIKDVIAYLRLLQNPRDLMAFDRLTQLLPGIGEKSARKLYDLFLETLETLPTETPSPLATSLQSCAAKVPAKTKVAWTQFTLTLSQLEELGLTAPPSKLLTLILDAGYDDHLKKQYDNYASRREDLDQLLRYASFLPDLQEFLAQMTLQSTADEPSTDKSARSYEPKILLSTIHQVKGLEFDVVYLLMLGDGLFPPYHVKDDPDKVEEERRLFYVALTRARKHLVLCYPKNRLSKSGDYQYQIPSRFLRELPPHLYKNCRVS